jgi:hypothetical protein
MKKLILAAVVGAFFVSTASAHQATYFMPQVPNPDNMVIDGNDDDWGWIDPAFGITPDLMFEILGNPFPPPKDDWDVVLFVAWSTQPDNALYYFARVTDDSLGLFVENPQEYWKDDSLEIIIDADHSSENFNETEQTSGQQYGVRIKPAAGQPDTWIFNVPQESILWSTRDPFMIFSWTVDPADAEPLSQPAGTTVSYTYEARQQIYTFHDKNGPDGSTEHIFAADQVIGLTFQFDETENPEVGREMQPGTTPVDGAFQDNSNGSDFITVPTDGATGGGDRPDQTAVESQSWGRIKSQMAR